MGISLVALLVGVCPRVAPAASLSSDAPATSVVLEGKVHLSGSTPIPLDDLPPGSYRFLVSGPGLYESLARLSWDPSRQRLASHGYTGAISLLYPPGLGHRRQGEGFRGALFTLPTLAGLAGLFESQFDLNAAQEDLDLAEQFLDSATTEAQAQLAGEAALFNADKVDNEKEMSTLWGVYTAYWWAGAAVETWLLTPRPSVVPGANGDFVVRAPRAGGGSAALKSLLVPGAGQRFLGNVGRGNLFTGGVSLFWAGGLIAQSSYLKAVAEQNRAQRLLDQADTPEEAALLLQNAFDARNTTRDRDRVRLALFGTAVLVHIWNIIDAAVMGQDRADLARFSWHVLPTPDGGLHASLTWRIS